MFKILNSISDITDALASTVVTVSNTVHAKVDVMHKVTVIEGKREVIECTITNGKAIKSLLSETSTEELEEYQRLLG